MYDVRCQMYDCSIFVKVHSCSGIDYFPIFYIKPGSGDVEFNKAFETEINDLYKEGETLLKIIVSTIVSSR